MQFQKVIAKSGSKAPVCFFLAGVVALLLSSCSMGSGFNRQKYTDLQLIRTIVPAENEYAQETELSVSQPNSGDTLTLSKKDREKAAVINQAIADGVPVVVHASGVEYLVQLPVYDSVNHRLCGTLTQSPGYNYQPVVHVYAKQSISVSLGWKCFALADMAAVEVTQSIASTEYDAASKVQLITAALDSNAVVYLNFGDVLYAARNPSVDSINNALCGEFFRADNEKVEPNITISLNSSGSKYLGKNCIPLEHTGKIRPSGWIAPAGNEQQPDYYPSLSAEEQAQKKQTNIFGAIVFAGLAAASAVGTVAAFRHEDQSQNWAQGLLNSIALFFLRVLVLGLTIVLFGLFFLCLSRAITL